MRASRIPSSRIATTGVATIRLMHAKRRELLPIALALTCAGESAKEIDKLGSRGRCERPLVAQDQGGNVEEPRVGLRVHREQHARDATTHEPNLP
jgi:hypothetical protein